jgi:type II secretory pathway pseudopilin PulG
MQTPTRNRIVALLLAVEATTLIAVFAHWIYLRLSLSHTLGLAAQILSAVGCAVFVGLAGWAAWRIGRRNHFRFSIRTMMIAIAIVGMALGLLLPRIQQNIEFQKRIQAYKLAQSVISSHNGQQIVSYASGSNGKHLHWTTEELVTPKESEFHQVLFAGEQLSDEELELLAGHPNLYSIAVHNCQFSVPGFLKLAKLNTLKLLDLRSQSIDAATLDEFQRLRPDCKIER